MTDPLTVFIGLRAIMLGAGAICFGTGAAILFLTPAQGLRVLRAMLQPILRIAAVVLAISAILALGVQAANAGEGWADAISPSVIYLYATATHAGRASMLRVVIALVSAAAILLAGHTRVRPLFLGSLVAGLFLASFAFSGHATMHEGLTGALHQANHIVHVLSGSFWLGALVGLFAAALIMHLRPASQDAKAAELMLWRFSPAGVGAVVLVGLSGAINTWLILGKAPTDVSSSYQFLLLAKIAAVLTMLGCALLNRSYFLPRVATPSGPDALVTSIAVECALGALVIGFVAMFATLEPI